MVETNDNLPRQGGVNWRPAVEVFSQISGWIVAPLVVSLIVGKKLDAHYGTEPWIFISLAAFGFLITCFGMVRVVRKYMKKLKQIEKDGNE